MQSIEERTSNQYQRVTELESSRLHIQENLLREFDRPVYERLLSGRHDVSVLDVGSNDGTCVMDRLGGREQVSLILGLEANADAVRRANESYRNDRVKFVCCNVEDGGQLDEVLSSYLRAHGMDGFDFVNVSMLLMHLADPLVLLERVRRFMRTDSVMFVRDVDDGENLAYPDDDGSFARAFDICDYLETSGFRHSGRQVPTLLQRAGFRDVTFERNGLSTVGLDTESRLALFHTYFDFVSEDLETMASRHPDDAAVRADMEWYVQQLPEFEEEFRSDDFFFQLGFMTFSARR